MKKKNTSLINVSWVIRGEDPNKTQIKQIQRLGKATLKKMILTGAKLHEIQDYLKDLKKIDKLTTEKRITKVSRKNITKLWSNQPLRLENGNFHVHLSKLKIPRATKMPGAKKAKKQGSSTVKNKEAKALENIKLGGYIPHQTIAAIGRRINNQQLINKLKQSNENYLMELAKQFPDKKRSELIALAKQVNTIDKGNAELVQAALEHEIIGPIIEAMGGWALANQKYPEAVERLINNYLL